MPPKSQIFTKDMESALIDEVEKRSLLWDARSSLYRRADLKPLAWEEVACALGEGFTGDMVAKRFKNMRENFSKNYARVRASKAKGSGSGYEDSFRPTWYLYERLKFLERSCVQTSSESNLPASTNPLQPALSSQQIADISLIQPNPMIYFDETLQSFQVIPAEEQTRTMSPPAPPHNAPNQNLEIHSVASSSASEDLNTSFSAPSSPMGQVRPLSAPTMSTSTKQAPTGEEFFNKRGGKKKGQTSKALETAVTVMQEIANQPPPTINVEPKPWDGICTFIANRLSVMPEDMRKQCENELVQVLLKY